MYWNLRLYQNIFYPDNSNLKKLLISLFLISSLCP